MTLDRTFSDAEYEVATQRQVGFIPGMAISRLHNKMYRQSSAMAKAIVDFLVVQSQNYMDNDVPGITNALPTAIQAIAGDGVEAHDNNPDAHGNRYLKLTGGTMTGSLLLLNDPAANMEAATKQYV